MTAIVAYYCVDDSLSIIGLQSQSFIRCAVCRNQAMKVCSFSGAPGAQKALLWLWASAEQLQPTAVTYSSLAAEREVNHEKP